MRLVIFIILIISWFNPLIGQKLKKNEIDKFSKEIYMQTSSAKNSEYNRVHATT